MYNIIPYELERKLDEELEGGERIEWKGMPVPRLFKPESIAIFLFAIPWTAFSLFWMAMAGMGTLAALDKGFNIMMLFPLFGLPFLGIGIFMLLTPYFSYQADKKTLYAVTDRRIVIIKGGRSIETKSYLPDQLEELTKRERSETGDLVFAHRSRRGSKNREIREEIGFFNITDLRGAQASIKNLIENSCDNSPDTAKSANPWELRS